MIAIIPAYNLPHAAWIPTLVIWHADGRFTRLEGGAVRRVRGPRSSTQRGGLMRAWTIPLACVAAPRRGLRHKKLPTGCRGPRDRASQLSVSKRMGARQQPSRALAAFDRLLPWQMETAVPAAPAGLRRAGLGA